MTKISDEERKDAKRKYKRDYNQKHRDKILKKRRERYQEKKEIILKQNRESFYRNHPEIKRRVKKTEVERKRAKKVSQRKNYLKKRFEKNPNYKPRKKLSEVERKKARKIVKKKSSKKYYDKNKDELKKKANALYHKLRGIPEYEIKFAEYNRRNNIQRRKKYHDMTLEEKRLFNHQNYLNSKASKQKYDHKYRESHREELSMHDIRRRAREKNARGEHTVKEWEGIKNLLHNHCNNCWKVLERPVKDHMIPLTKDGTDYVDNLQPLCKSCNSRKHNKYDVPTLVEIAKKHTDMLLIIKI